MTNAADHQTEYAGTELGDVSCSCGWQVCRLTVADADAAVMRHLIDEGVIV